MDTAHAIAMAIGCGNGKPVIADASEQVAIEALSMVPRETHAEILECGADGDDGGYGAGILSVTLLSVGQDGTIRLMGRDLPPDHRQAARLSELLSIASDAAVCSDDSAIVVSGHLGQLGDELCERILAPTLARRLGHAIFLCEAASAPPAILSACVTPGDGRVNTPRP